MKHIRKRLCLLLALTLLLQGSPAVLSEESGSESGGGESQHEESKPTKAPDPDPTKAPDPDPTKAPDPDPTKAPDPDPTKAPDDEPTKVPDSGSDPTNAPDTDPTNTPDATQDPTAPTQDPSAEPSADPGTDPTNTPAPTLPPEGEGDQEYGDVPDYSDEIDENDPYSGWFGVVHHSGGGMDIPRYYQTDYTKTVCTIRGLPRSVATSGCCATSLSMCIAYLTGNTDQTPYTLFVQAYEEGRYDGAGWSHETLSHYAHAYGLKTKWVGRNRSEILRALKSGKPVIAHMGPGIFTSSGHYIVLRGVTSDGKILVNDPISPFKNSMAFPVETIFHQARSSSPFCILSADEDADDYFKFEPNMDLTLDLKYDVFSQSLRQKD